MAKKKAKIFELYEEYEKNLNKENDEESKDIFTLYDEYEKKLNEETARNIPTPSEAQTSRQTVDQLGNLGNMVKKTETETLPKITNEAIKNYNLSKTGRDYLSKYDDSTSYADIKKDIAEVQSKRDEDSSKKDEYDLAFAMLNNYVNQKYDLNGTDLSQDAIKRRQEVYDYNQNEIDNINSKVEANEGNTENLDLDNEETVSKYLNHDKDAVDFFLGYRSGRITQDAANQEKYITMRNYIENAANSDSVRDLRNEAENLRAQNAAYDRTQGQSDKYALQYGEDVKNEEPDLLTGTLHTRNTVPENFNERVKKGDDTFTDMGDISQPAIKRNDGANAVEDYNNMDAHTEMLTAEEKEIYSYILRNEGEVSANAYLGNLKDVLQKRSSETTQNYIDNASGAEKAVLLAASVPMNVYGTVTGFAEDAANIAAGKDIHPYSEAHSMYNIAQQTRSSVAEDIDEATNSWNVLGFSAGDAFQAAMSIPDFMLGALTPSYYAASMSMGAAQSTAKELWEEGATNEQIVAESVLSGAAEYVFEKVSLDKILDTADKSKLIKSALAGMAIEGSEEANTEIANIISDVLVRGSQSDWNKAIQSYKNQGYSDSEAQAKAFGDMAKRVGYSAVGGAIGGAGGGAGVALEKGVGLIQNKAERNKYIASTGANIYNTGNIQNLIDKANESDNDEVKAQLAKVKTAQENNNENKLIKEAGKLYSVMQSRNMDALDNSASEVAKSALREAYAKETGEDVTSDNVVNAADAIYKAEYTSESLTPSERRIVSESASQKAYEAVKNDSSVTEKAATAMQRAMNDLVSTAALTQEKEKPKSDNEVLNSATFDIHEDDGKVYTKDGQKQVDLASVSAVNDNDISFSLKNGETESLNNLDLPKQQAVLAQSIIDVQKDTGISLTPDAANTIFQGYDKAKDSYKSVGAYMLDARKVLFNGYTNNTAPDNTIKLPQSLRNSLYSIGRQLSESSAISKQKAVRARINGIKTRKGAVSFRDGMSLYDNGKVSYEENGKTYKLDPMRQASVDFLSMTGESLGFDIVFYRSTKDGKGRFSSKYVTDKKFGKEGQQAPSGFWRGGKMYIDVNAGMNGEGLILFTASHELVHMIREGSPEDFKALADFLVQNYSEQGTDINDLIRMEMAKSTNLTRDEAYEEVIADACESFLRDTLINGKAKALYQENPTLWAKIKNALKTIIDRLKSLKPQSKASQKALELGVEKLETAYDLFTRGIERSAQNLRSMEGEKSQNSRYTFAGREANNADVGTLEEAQQMEEKGVDSEDIRQQTGWFKGLDGLWRFELDDSQMRIKDTEPRYGKLYLHEAIDYPQLFEAYPRLESFVVSYKDMPEGERGSWDASRRTIEINNKLRQDEDALTETLIHELQHAVQRIEGFAKGASPQYWYNAFGLGEDNRTIAEKKEASSRRRQNESEYNETKQADPEFVERIERIDSTINSFVYDEATQEAWDKAQEDIKNIKEKYGEEKVNHFLYVVRSRRTAESTVGRMSKPFDLYQATAGEVEARDSASRRGYTAEQRRNIRPDVDREDVVFRPGDDANVKYKSREDADYMSAVENGDMETAQRMVDEAAKRAFPNTKVRYSDGDLKRVYHGRVSEFNVFERKYGNAEGNFGKGFYFTDDLNDVESNYANEEGPDLENKIARLAERLENEEVFEDYDEAEEEARRRLITSEPNTVEAYLNMANPVYISTENKGTYLDLEYGYDEETDEYDDEPSGLLYDFVEALGENICEYVDYDTVETIKAQILESAYYEGMYAYDLTEAIRNMEATFDIYDNEGNLYISEAIRQSFEDIGFDGIIDNAVSQKFDNMRLREDTTHYIVFNSEQIKIADPVTYDDNGEVIPLSERFNESNKDIRYKSRDNDYLNAVEEGNIETAQKMVNEAAKDAGAYTQYGSYTPELFYHGTRAGGFTEFRYSRNNQTGTDYGKAFYFTTDYEKATGYAYDISKDSRVNDYKAERDRLTKEFLKNPTTENKERLKKHHETLYEIIDGDNNGGLQEGTEVKSTYLFMKNPLVVDANGEYYYKVYPDYFKAAKQLGSDGIVVHNVVDNPRGKARPITVGIVFESNQIKSADPVTYDDNGDVIPLSERFNESNKDIRYQSRNSTDNIAYKYAVKNEDTARAQKIVDRTANRVFANSKVRGKDGKLRKVYHYTNTDFYSFDTGRSGKNQGQTHGDGIYISTSPDEFSYAGKKRMTLYANITNPFEMELTEEQARDVLEKYAVTKHNLDQYDGLYRNHAMNALQSPIKVFDYLKEYADDNGVKVSDILQDLGFDGVHDGSEWVAFSSEQLKSADPITYDDDGKVIPLSQRFDTVRTDIRYKNDRVDENQFQDFEISDWEFDDTTADTIAREYVSHHEDIGEVLKNIADIDITPAKVTAIVNRVLRENIGALDKTTRELLSTEVQIALDRVNRDDPATVINNMTQAVRDAIENAYVPSEKAEADYKELLSVFKGKRFYLSEEQLNYLKEHDSSLGKIHRELQNRVNIVDKNNLKRSINGRYQNAQELSLEGLYDVLESPDEYLSYKRDEWDEYGYKAPFIIRDALNKLRDMRSQRITEVYSSNAIDDMAVTLSAKITGGIVEAKYNSRKNPYITKLVNDLKAKRSEAVKKQKEKYQKKLSELKQKERERAAKRERELSDKYKEQRERGRENRKRTEFRNKIRKLMNSFQSKLTKPRDGSYVPRELIAQTVDVLNSINMDTGRSVNLSEKIAALRNTYDGLRKDAEAQAIYNDTISEMLRGLSVAIKNTSIMDMSLEQLQMVYDALRSLDHYIRESVKMTDTEEKRSAHALGRAMIAETREASGGNKGILSGYVQAQLRADVMFNRLGGFKKNSTWLQMARMLNDGQLHMTQLQMEFSKIFADVLTDIKQLRTLSNTKNLIDIGLVDDDGKTVKITRGMMLSLYMHLLNEDNTRHVMGGGLTVPGIKEYYKGDLTKAFGEKQRSVRVGQIDFTEYAEGIKTVIEEQLTDYEKVWIGLAHEFFDDASRNAINDTTMKLYGFKRATVTNYFPIHTDSNYRAASFESITRDMSLENSGFMKERIKASNPILLEDIVDVINDQIQKVSKYCGLTIPINNFQKVYGTTLAGYESSLQKEINKKFSGSKSNTSATKYIDNLITDLTSGRQTSEGPFAKFFTAARGNLAKATLTINARVAIAQAASYPTAAAEIGWKPLLKAAVKGGRSNRMFSRADRAAIEEVSPLLWLRTQGYSNTEIGDIKELRKQKHKIEGKFKKAMGWIEFFDGMTVGRLYYAAQYAVDEKYPSLKRGTEEYKQKVAEVYNDIIEKTQPNYTVLQRPDILRNPNAVVKSLTMFMTQRLQNFNIVYDAAGTYNKYRKDFKSGKNGVTALDVKEAGTKLRRAVISQVVASTTIVGMKLFADFLLHSLTGYRDDDDEVTAESVALALMSNFADTIFSSVLFGSDLYKLIMSVYKGEKFDGVSQSGIDSLKDMLSSVANVGSNVFQTIKGEETLNWEYFHTLGKQICLVFGIPLNNAEKIGKAVYYWTSDLTSGNLFESDVKRSNKQNIHRVETRMSAGDTEEAKEIVNAMIKDKISNGKTEKEAKQSVRTSFTQEYKPRYLEAVKNNNEAEIKNIRQLLLNTGVYGSLSDLDKSMAEWRKDLNKKE